MVRVLGGAAALVVCAGSSIAGGIERSTQSVSVLFEEGRYAELSFGSIQPSISGVQSVGGIDSGSAIQSFTSIGFAYKQDLGEKLSLALIMDQPIGADVEYPTGTGYAFAGGNATVDSVALTTVLNYQIDDNFSVHGGLRVMRTGGNVGIPAFGNYEMSVEKETDLGYVIGGAYEIPDIALRVALTYNSAVTHKFGSVSESYLGGTGDESFEVEIPQSVNLEFQTGVSQNTLIFGSARWVEWTAFDITPVLFTNGILPGESIVSYADDVVTYRLGVGHRFNENWSGALILGHEKSNGGFRANLGPTDGFDSITLAATYTMDNMKFTGGLTYIDINDATTNLRAGGEGQFKGNDTLALGFKIGVHF